MSFHKLAKAKDKRFWSVRVSQDIRLIVHRTADSLLLCYVDHHDKAYALAEGRKLETHPTTGAAQLVEIRERVQEIVAPAYVQPPPERAPKKPLFVHVSDDELLSYGVPAEWLTDVRQATDDTVLVLADHLPAEAAEALLELATGGTPHKPRPGPSVADPFDHPDARRRFRVVTDVDELARALEYPWERWTVFLHPAQRELAEHRFGGPARIAGSAGTGKTVVALHRAAHLARANPDARSNTEKRGGTVSVFNGPPPPLRVLESAEEESAAVGRWLAERAAEGMTPGEMSVFVRSPVELPRARAAVDAALEFRAVAVMACDDEVVPLQARIEAVTDEGDLEEVYDTERHVLYVACTRARDHLLVTGVNPASEFLDDLRGSATSGSTRALQTPAAPAAGRSPSG